MARSRLLCTGTIPGAVSVVDLETGKTALLASRRDWEAVDGIVWTPWNTLLVTEEQKNRGRPDPDWPHAARGLVYEILLDAQDPSRARQVLARPLLGSLTHEGIEIDADGNIYVIDENRNGGIFRFVPEKPGRLDSGRLFALRVTNDEQTGAAEWLPLQLDPETFDAREAARNTGASAWCRPEDIERIDAYITYGKVCAKPIDVQCRTKAGIDWLETGQVYTCDRKVGGVCTNFTQKDGDRCLDYEVRFLCP